jgi:hypothetical protein
MWIAAHGSYTVAIPDLLHNRAVAGPVGCPGGREDARRLTRRRITIGVPRKSAKNL